MKANKFFMVLALSSLSLGFSSCLDFDDPDDKYQYTEMQAEDVVLQGKADSIGYLEYVPSETGVDEAIQRLDTYLRMTITGQFAMRGGKNGDMPGEHAYQRQYSLGPDNYAQYSTVPHFDFMYGTLESTYDVSDDFNAGPNSSYLIVKNAIAPILNHPDIDSIPEMKAIYLLMFDFASQEVADIYGPYPYADFKANREESPFTYNDLSSIYFTIEANIDTIVNVLKHYDTRPEWYKTKVQKLMTDYTRLTQDLITGKTGMDTWIRFANSLKLRMAMRIVKVDPEMAQKWAEEAVAAGVVEGPEQELAFSPLILGFTNPLLQIWNGWGDNRLSASFESLLMSLGHPYAEYLFAKNGNKLTNEVTGEVLPEKSRIVGLREGITPGQGQGFATNPMIGFSQFVPDVISIAPLYLMKMSEVDFLRAEGAVRGWNMGGTAQEFYERGIEYGYLDERMVGADPTYTSAMATYMNLEAAYDYTYHDPLGRVPDEPSLTKIGVKWNDGDDKETKLEKIITQKYIAGFPNSFEAWADLRRTGYPKLFPVLNPDDGDGSLNEGDIIRRCVFPNTDDSSLRDIQETGLSALGGPDQQATRLWWDIDVPNF
ncbi:MAG: SusD/RagB family nutrient-binding outer membrane lipoprotein [Bacteroidaceae bacterium]|nr:SusD/RagB family nutrient-binding outer membrane lipoprotein [Bacteroidaceae bacterium]